jgi:hypothetical protein
MVRAEDVWSGVEVKCGQVIFEGKKFHIFFNQ